MYPTAIAKVCHQANKAICEAFGDLSQRDWGNADDWQKESAIAGVMFRLAHPDAPTSAQHHEWMAAKIKAGWVYGPIKDAEKKEHPCLVPFGTLPPEQQVKDYVFQAIVDALRNNP